MYTKLVRIGHEVAGCIVCDVQCTNAYNARPVATMRVDGNKQLSWHDFCNDSHFSVAPALQVATLPAEQQYSVSSSNPTQFMITYSYQKRLFELSGVYMNVDAGTHYQPNSSLNGLARVELFCWLPQPYAMNHCNFAEKMALRHLNEQRQKKIIEPLRAAKRIIEKVKATKNLQI